MSWEHDDDPNLPLPEDMHDDEDDYDLAEMACPNCGAVVTEDTQKCPACGDWITPVEPGAGGIGSKKWWLAIGVLLMLLAMWRLVF